PVEEEVPGRGELGVGDRWAGMPDALGPPVDPALRNRQRHDSRPITGTSGDEPITGTPGDEPSDREISRPVRTITGPISCTRAGGIREASPDTLSAPTTVSVWSKTGAATHRTS